MEADAIRYYKDAKVPRSDISFQTLMNQCGSNVEWSVETLKKDVQYEIYAYADGINVSVETENGQGEIKEYRNASIVIRFSAKWMADSWLTTMYMVKMDGEYLNDFYKSSVLRELVIQAGGHIE